MTHALDFRFWAARKSVAAPALMDPLRIAVDEREKVRRTDGANEPYLPGLRPVENELDVFLLNKFLWLG